MPQLRKWKENKSCRVTVVLKRGYTCKSILEHVIKIMVTIIILKYEVGMVSFSFCLGETQATGIQIKAGLVRGGEH